MGQDTTTSKMTVPELEHMSIENINSVMFAAQKGMQRYASNIMGSHAYIIMRESDFTDELS